MHTRGGDGHGQEHRQDGGAEPPAGPGGGRRRGRGPDVHRPRRRRARRGVQLSQAAGQRVARHRGGHGAQHLAACAGAPQAHRRHRHPQPDGRDRARQGAGAGDMEVAGASRSHDQHRSSRCCASAARSQLSGRRPGPQPACVAGAGRRRGAGHRRGAGRGDGRRAAQDARTLALLGIAAGRCGNGCALCGLFDGTGVALWGARASRCSAHPSPRSTPAPRCWHKLRGHADGHPHRGLHRRRGPVAVARL
jgi:hypothetical protein